MTQREALHLLIDQLSDAEIEFWFVVHPSSQQPSNENSVDWIYQAKQYQSQQWALILATGGSSPASTGGCDI